MQPRFAVPTVSLLIAAALVALSAFGIVGLGRDGFFNFDGQVLWAAGRTWLQGANPYDYPSLARAAEGIPGMDVSQVRFFYPPQASALCVPLGLFPYAVARWVWLAFNLAAIATMVGLACGVVREETPNRRVLGAGVLAAVLIGNPFTAHVVWMGQTSLVAFAATFAAWRFAGSSRWLAAGICLGLASYKPQICMFVVLWLLLERNWRVLLTSGLAAATLSLYPIISQGPLGALLAWRNGVSSGYGLEFNLPSFSHKVGLESLLYGAGLSVSAGALLAVGILLTVVLWRYRTRLLHNDILGLLMAITFIFSGYLHDYDYVALAPIYISLWRLAPTSLAATISSLILVALLFVPQRLLHVIAIPVLEQWRTVVIIALAGIILFLGVSRSPQRGVSQVPTSTPS
jgi:Glycosyltransferase family 87